MAAKHPDRKIPRPASRPLETLTKIAAQNPDGFLFMAYLLSRTVVRVMSDEVLLVVLHIKEISVCVLDSERRPYLCKHHFLGMELDF